MTDDAKLLEGLAAARAGMPLARAARIAEVPLEDFMELASRYGVSVLTGTTKLIADDVRAIEEWRAKRDRDDEEFRRRFDEIERRWWPVLAALAHEHDSERVPTMCRDEWLLIGPSEPWKGPGTTSPGKWCVEREGLRADDLWRLVVGAVGIGKLYVAKASGTKRASFYGGKHLIAVYTPDARDLEDVWKARAVLRELGVTEPLTYRDNDGEALLRE